MRRRLVVPVLALLLPLGCSTDRDAKGTSSHSGDRSPEPGVSASAQKKKASYTYRLPIAAYSYSDSEYAEIEAAEQVLTKKCMSAFGLSYRPAEDSTPISSDRRYGLSDMGEAMRYGYRLPPQSSMESNPHLTADERLVLYGGRGVKKQTGKLEYRGETVPEEGCLAKSVHELSEKYDYPAGVDAASRIASQSYQESLQSARVKVAFREWSGCMKKRGFSYASPIKAMGSPSFSSGQVTGVEKRTAEADVACKQQTNLLESWFGVESGIQKGLIKEEFKKLQKLGRLHEEKVKAARGITAGS